MAKIVYGAGVSHTPMLTLDPSEWEVRSNVDYNNPCLNTSDGRWLTYPQLEAEVGAPQAAVANFEVYREKSAGAHASLDRVAADLSAAAPDVVMIVGDDQRELFTENNQPPIAIFHGDTLITTDSLFNFDGAPEWMKPVALGYAMDECRSFPAAPDLALDVIEGLMARNFDVASIAAVSDPSKVGFGHAFGFVINRLFGGRRTPVLPILLNTYYPPNVPSAARCYDLGRALREIIEASPSAARVAVIASGGLSHFVVDKDLDQGVLSAMTDSNADFLRGLPAGALHSGSSEILNWVTLAGALAGHAPKWTEYFPIYRTPAGTGVGMAFASWPLAA